MIPWRPVAARLVLLPPTLLGVLVVTFVLLQLIPGNPIDRMLGERGATAEQRARLVAAYGLDRPHHERFALYVSRVARGDFGVLPGSGRPVLEEFLDRLPNTLRLAGAALALSLVVGIPAGILSGLRPGSRIDLVACSVSTLFQSTPVFWSGLVLIYVFAWQVRLFPPSGDGQGALANLVLPTLTLGLRPAAFLQRIVRSSLLEVLGQDYVRTARAKGLAESVVIGRHALANALIPIVTVIAMDLGALLSGSVITESIFHYRGIGTFILYGITNRIYEVVLVAALFTTLVFMVANLVTDLLYLVIDPRVREAAV